MEGLGKTEQIGADRMGNGKYGERNHSKVHEAMLAQNGREGS